MSRGRRWVPAPRHGGMRFAAGGGDIIFPVGGPVRTPWGGGSRLGHRGAGKGLAIFSFKSAPTDGLFSEPAFPCATGKARR